MDYVFFQFYLPTELLLKFPNKPHMDLLICLPRPVWNMDNNSLPIASKIHLTARSKNEFRANSNYTNILKTLQIK